MNTVTFGTVNSSTDLKMYLVSEDLTPPEQVRSNIEVPGRHSVLDTTYFLTQEPIFAQRTATYEFITTREEYSSWDDAYDAIVNAIHGLEVNIYPDSHDGYYLVGNVQVTKFEVETIARITVTCEVDPFFYKTTETTSSTTLSSSNKSVTLSNGRKWVMPYVTCTGSATVVCNGTTTTVGTVTSQQYDGIVLKSGSNTITVKGSGTLTLRYREAKL